MNKIATFVKQLDGFTGQAALYRLSEPILQERYGDVGAEQLAHEYVVVSSTNAFMSGPETYIFPSDKNGKVVNWAELDGSRRGSYSHADVLRNAGYEVVP